MGGHPLHLHLVVLRQAPKRGGLGRPEVEGPVLERRVAHDQVLGRSPHLDAVGLMLLLLQVSPVPDLQIWREAPLGSPGIPRRGGDAHQRDRAVVNAHHEWVSVTDFHLEKFGDTYGPLEEIVGAAGDAPIWSSKLEGKNIMDAMMINPA
ncbi:hypothetical protein HU200_009638 [Digitaria exilis]|uniref:Uncharacterized protein n=1 Tax=Digitaria exilis TaxID=1010633 RepID=A0A835KP93_9POAL|nr:hypothetical protein HU200_009638 [Digitaria exilis]